MTRNPNMSEKRRKGVPPASSAAALKRMRSTGRRDTVPEIALRRTLHRMGLRYRIDRKPLPYLGRRADLVFASAKVAVYVDGCFWHGCPLHATWPKKNAEFWRNKIETNRARDADTDRRLEECGWISVHVWEHEDSKAAAERVRSAIESRLLTRPRTGG
jgi:DNA mismatch endonuclease, patch repair protein